MLQQSTNRRGRHTRSLISYNAVLLRSKICHTGVKSCVHLQASSDRWACVRELAHCGAASAALAARGRPAGSARATHAEVRNTRKVATRPKAVSCRTKLGAQLAAGASKQDGWRKRQRQRRHRPRRRSERGRGVLHDFVQGHVSWGVWHAMLVRCSPPAVTLQCEGRPSHVHTAAPSQCSPHAACAQGALPHHHGGLCLHLLPSAPPGAAKGAAAPAQAARRPRGPCALCRVPNECTPRLVARPRASEPHGAAQGRYCPPPSQDLFRFLDVLLYVEATIYQVNPTTPRQISLGFRCKDTWHCGSLTLAPDAQAPP